MWLPHLFPVLTLALGEVLPRSHRATVPQASCWDPVKSSHWYCYRKDHTQERGGPECSLYAHCPFSSRDESRNQEKRRGGEENSILKGQCSAHPLMSHIASSLGSLTHSSLTPTLCLLLHSFMISVSLNLLHYIVLICLSPPLNLKFLEGSNYTALFNQVIFIELLLYTRHFSRHWRLGSELGKQNPVLVELTSGKGDKPADIFLNVLCSQILTLCLLYNQGVRNICIYLYIYFLNKWKEL